MVLYVKKEDGERHIYGSWEHTVPSEGDSRIEIVGGEGSLDKHYFDDKKGGIIDEDGNAIKVMLDGIAVFPRRLNPEPEPTPVDPVTPVPSTQVDAEVAEDSAYFVANVYNKKETGAYINRENDEDVANHYYVKVAENVTADLLDQISIGSVDVTKTFALSIGKSAFVSDMPFYVDDNNDMFVAFPLLMFEDDVRIGDLMVYVGGHNINELALTEVRIAGNGGSTAEIDPNGKVQSVMKSRTDYILYGIENTAASDVFITKKESDDFYDGGEVKHPISYGFSTGDPVGDGYGMGYYPFGWASTAEAWNTKPRNINFDYTLYVVGKGICHIKSVFDREDM